MPGVTVDGGDPVRVRRRWARPSRAPARATGRRWSSRGVYRLSAHGNIIAPPGVPLHSRSTRRSRSSAAPEEYEAALRGDPVPRFRARLVTDGAMTAEEADRIAGDVRQEMPGRRFGLAARSPSSSRRASTSTPEDRRDPWHTSCPTSPPSTRPSSSRWSATRPSCYFGQNMATTENEDFVTPSGADRVRVTPISETAEIGIATGAAHGRLPARRRALHGRVHARRHGPGGQRGRRAFATCPAARSRCRWCSRPATASPPAGRASTPARSTRCSWACRA